MTPSERLRAAKARAVRAILARLLVLVAIFAIGHCLGGCESAAQHLLESPWNR